MDKEDKDKIIRGVYYDSDTGFGSIAETYKESKRILSSITYNDVKEFLEKQSIRQVKAYRGFNSYVATEPLQEIQIDIADFTASGSVNDNYRYCFVATDIFTKYCHAVAIKDKQPTESVRAMKEVLSNIGTPKVLYHDNEGSWNSKEFVRLINAFKIRQIITSSPPPFAERMVQTIKNMIYTRLGGLDMNKQEWVNLLPAVLKKYNNTKHSTIGVSPNTAIKGNDNIEIWLNIYNKATFKRRYPPLKASDQVRVYIKPKTFKKGYESSWSKELYKVVAISGDGKQFMVNNNTRRLYSRHELLKINGADGKDG